MGTIIRSIILEEKPQEKGSKITCLRSYESSARSGMSHLCASHTNFSVRGLPDNRICRMIAF